MFHAETGPYRPLSDLSRGTRVRRQLSREAVAALTTDPNTGLAAVPADWLGGLERGEDVAAPTPERTRALAAVLGLSHRTVQEAAGAQFWGHQTVWSEDGRTRAFIRADGPLTLEQIGRVRRLMDRVFPSES